MFELEPKKNKTMLMHIRFLPKQRYEIERMAEKHGLSLADVIRQMVKYAIDNRYDNE